MTVTVSLLKKTRQQCIVKFVGTGIGNVTYLDLKMPDDTMDMGNIQMNITNLVWSSSDAVATPIIVSRPYLGANTHILHGNDNWGLTQNYSISDTQNTNANISVAFPSPAGGTLYMMIHKPAGFIAPDQQNNYTAE
jgi:hypothetical protein